MIIQINMQQVSSVLDGIKMCLSITKITVTIIIIIIRGCVEVFIIIIFLIV